MPRLALGLLGAALVLAVAVGVLLLSPIGRGGHVPGAKPPATGPVVDSACLFSDVGQVEIASTGDTVVCRLEDGRYRWRS